LKLGDPLVLAGEVLALMLPLPQQQLLLDLDLPSYVWEKVRPPSSSKFNHGHLTTIFIISKFMLLLLKISLPSSSSPTHSKAS
jgi:hypothetical protein